MAEKIKEAVEEEVKETAQETKEEETKQVSYLFRLEEMVDAMRASKDNLIKVRGEQAYLIEKLESLNDEKLAALVKSMQEQVANLDKQELKLNAKIEDMKAVVEKAKANPDYETFLDQFIDAIGMYDNM